MLSPSHSNQDQVPEWARYPADGAGARRIEYFDVSTRDSCAADARVVCCADGSGSGRVVRGGVVGIFLRRD